MHEDICTSAENKQVAIAILPYHKEQRLDGTLETTRADFRGVNQRVLSMNLAQLESWLISPVVGPTQN
ncbi:cation/H+ exchanger [Thalictrum thalictroides]|uniref:Cation/H+ exchanger n=1 Tax=Thalictrum thalictroides TaxID=46969 RepID=A0A7J6UT02_THATH|nr:cation/H+ exchanger [Thalictrum thalictroides]